MSLNDKHVKNQVKNTSQEISLLNPNPSKRTILAKQRKTSKRIILAPAGFRITVSDSRVSLKWEPTANAKFYRLFKGFDPLFTPGLKPLINSAASQTGAEDRSIFEPDGFDLIDYINTPETQLLGNSTLPNDASLIIYEGEDNAFIDTNIYPGNTYYYKVCGINDGFDHLYSMSSATTLFEIPQIQSINVISSFDTSLILTWDPINGANNYTIEQSLHENFLNDITVAYTGSSHSCTLTNLDPAVQLYLRIYASMAGHEIHNYYYFGEKPDVSIEAPTNFISSNIGDRTIILNWDTIEDFPIENYILESATDINFTENLINQYSGPLITKTVNGLTPNTTYYFRVRGFITGYTVINYAIIQQETYPALVAPQNFTAGEIQANQLTLTWDAVPHATGYELQRADDDGFSINTAINHIGTDTTIVVGGLEAAHTYHYRIYAIAPFFSIITYAYLTIETIT